MLPELRQDRSALRWIRGELDQNLRKARASLEDYAEGQRDRLNECTALLHDVHGVLEMVQVYGGAMLADEMEQLAHAMSAGQVKGAESAAEALMLGLVQLPAYLEKVEAGGADIPLVLLPLMNDLRAARDASLVSETSLFAPKLSTLIAAETVRPGSGNRDLPRLIHHHRSHYHRGLLNWIRNQHVRASLGQIRDVLDVLNSAAGTARLRRLLDAAEALTIALTEDGEAPALAVKPLFGKLDRVFKKIIDQGEEAAMLDFPVDLLKNLLYYIARSNSRDPAVVSVKQSADLVNSFADQSQAGAAVDALGAPDRELFTAVGEALSHDLRDVKDQLDLYIRGDRGQIDRLTGLAQPIQRIGDTLGMVGRGELRTRLKHFSDELDAANESGEVPPDERLMALASELLYVESSLAGLASGEHAESALEEPMEGSVSQMLSEGEMRQHQHAAIDEALVEMAKTKDDILEYLEQPDSPQRLADVPSRLHAVAGVMTMLEMPAAGRLLDDLKPYIGRLSDGDQDVPDMIQRDALADVVMSAELYMQSAIEPGADRDHLLSYADKALQVLGLRKGEEAAIEAVTVVGVELGVAAAGGRAAVGAAYEAAFDSVDAAPDVSVGRIEAEPPTEVPEGPPADETHAVEEVVVARAGETTDVAPVEEVATPEAQPVTTESEQADVDSEILEVFAEEAQEELEVIQRCLPSWLANTEDKESLQTMRRSFHTLKGSGRIVGAKNIGEFSWAVENLLNRVIDGTVAASSDLLTLMGEVGEVLPALVAESSSPGTPDSDVSQLAERAFALASGTYVGTAEAPQTEQPSAPLEPEHRVVELPQEPEEEPVAEVSEAEMEPEAASLASTEKASDAPLTLPDDNLDIPSIDVAESPEPVLSQEHEPLSLEGFTHPDDESLLLEAVEENRRPAMAGAQAGAGEKPDESILTATEVQDSEFSELDTSGEQSGDTSLNAVFLSEAHSHLKVLDDFIQRCVGMPGGGLMEAGVRRAMHTLRGSARTADFQSIADLAGALEAFSETMQNEQRRTDSRILDMLNRSHGMLSRLTAAVDDPQVDASGWQVMRDEIDSEAAALAEPAPSATDSQLVSNSAHQHFDPELLEIFLDEAKELLESLEGELNAWEGAGGGDDRSVANLQRNLHTMKGGARLAGINTVGDLSHALESVFESVVERRVEGSGRLKGLVRHATDVLAQDIDELIRGNVPSDHPVMLERLEAAARGREWDDVAAVEAAIESEQALETPDVAEAVDNSSPFPGEPSSELVEEDLDADSGASTEGLEAESIEVGPDSELLSDSQLMTDSELLDESSFLVAEAPDAQEKEGASTGTVVQFPSSEMLGDAADGFVPRKPLPEEPAAPTTGSERVRVASDTLDQMVNNAGEVSVYRARIEQQNGRVAFNLGELQQTTDRLRSQLRGLELETEAQILSRHERDSESRADFDPLELDRYSAIQQLSRALSETVEDLSNLGQSLTDLSRDTDTLLMQQARVTTDLQDGLLRTRMVRFASRVPRLERVVRQTSHSVGKHADLEVVGGEEDMDRAILERMMGPLEHLLRNAVSHGIEDADTRKANGKSAQGLITLQLAREGTDVVLTLSDDGVGLNRARIREKAVERGLIEQDAVIDDDDLYQLILQSGFSTAKELSQVSGRGVGMDVVLTEVKQLGGTLEIDSQPGYGTSFTIRLPFTLAITDALLVTVGEDFYAVPHSSMDGVARIDVDELRAIYTGRQEHFSYAGRDYTVRYLGSMLGLSAPSISEGVRWVPLLLVRSGEHRVAIQVDGLLGNRQIVVKSIGAQLSGVRWFTGGTILADGQIALILDTGSLVRMDSAHQPILDESQAEPAGRGVSVMVVDDSITVRKVTSRLLERHNMHVITAKDGVDAVTQLQEAHPDVMLLDIEMPRMDGYELARHMRTTAELNDIPIIMITSRTGDKHRARATELGVKRYLGKPYQEAELLENIYTVLAETAL